MTPLPRTLQLAVLVLAAGCDDASKTDNRAAAPESAPVASADPKPAAERDAKADTKTEAPKKDATSPAADASPSPTPAPSDTDDAAAPLEEKAGGLEVGMALARVKELLPGLKADGKKRENGESGLFEQSWKDGTGVHVTMVAETRNGAPILDVVLVTSPSTLESAHGIGVGDSLDAMKKAYGDAELYPDEEGRSEVEYDGITFTLEDGKVQSFAFGNLSCGSCG